MHDMGYKGWKNFKITRADVKANNYMQSWMNMIARKLFYIAREATVIFLKNEKAAAEILDVEKLKKLSLDTTPDSISVEHLKDFFCQKKTYF